jgi:hypothetical protein
MTTIRFSQALEDEIDYLIGARDEMDDGDQMTRAEAIRTLMGDMQDREHPASEFRRELQDFGAAIGVYVALTKDQLDNVTVWSARSGYRQKYDFKRGDRYYVFESWKPLDGVA